DLEDLRAAVRARPLDRGATVFHGHLLGVFDLDLLALFDAVTLWHVRLPPSVDGEDSRGPFGRLAVNCVTIATNRLQDSDFAVIPDHEPVGAGLAVVAGHADVAPQQRRLHPAVEAADRRALQQDRVLDLGVLDHAPRAHRRV